MEENELKRLEDNINNSPYFSITGDNMEAARATALNKLAKDLLDYGKHYWTRYEYDEHDERDEHIDGIPYWKMKKILYKDVVAETMTKCIKNYNPERACLTNYFKNQVKYAILNKYKEYKKKTNRQKKYIANEFSEELDSLHTDDFIEKLIFSLIQARILDIFEQAFLELNLEKTRARFPTILTRRCFKGLAGMTLPDKRYQWIDYTFLEKYKEDPEALPTQKELATMLGLDETTISHDVGIFRDHLEPLLKKEKII